jgi:hypothetical protein
LYLKKILSSLISELQLKKMKHLLSLIILTVSMLSAMGQSNDISLILDKKWIISDYIVAKKTVATTDYNPEDYTIFKSDSTTESKYGGIITLAKWKVNSDLTNLILYSEENDEKSIMKIIELSKEKIKFFIGTEMELTIVMTLKSN